MHIGFLLFGTFVIYMQCIDDFEIRFDNQFPLTCLSFNS